jgi:hypothetical protein
MRTTVTLDPDVARQIRERMRDQNLGFKEVVNQALRAGLRSDTYRDASPFVVEPHPCGFHAGIDLDKLNQLADELESQEESREFAR